MNLHDVVNLFNFDALSIIMISLVGFIGVVVASFSSRYLKGDMRYSRFFGELALLLAAVIVMVSADHLALLLIAWGASNWLLVRLMIHKSGWRAAKASGILAGKNFIVGFSFIALAFMLLYVASGHMSITAINQNIEGSALTIAALVLLLLGAMTQSAIWPFHKWLTSSLNSPTPVSAIMHAGLINGGGFLQARFAPVYVDISPTLLGVIFVIGLVTTVMGTLWKLIQTDIKRMLACSTMAQMGFMLAQCGLGLFPAAVAHLCWHGLYKAYQFLGSGNAAQEKRYDRDYTPGILAFSLALSCGALASVVFTWASGKPFIADSTLVLIAIAAIAGSQFALAILHRKPLVMFPVAIIATSLMSGVYGGSIQLIANILDPLNLMQPQPLNALHIAGIIILALLWIGVLFSKPLSRMTRLPDWLLRVYVKALNASQPHTQTVTAYRNHYDYR